MTGAPIRWDDLWGWHIAPRVAWEAGEGCLVRALTQLAAI